MTFRLQNPTKNNPTNTIMVENVNALSLLKEEMQTEEIHLKVNAIHRLKTVILSIGINETTN